MPGYLGFDYGLRRIGIAASDERGRLAFALGTHVEGRDGSILARIRSLAAERGPVALVVGLPLTADGREARMAVRTRQFAEMLQRELGLPVVLWDERYSSAEAQRWLRTRRRPAREETDALAAQIILQSYLDSLRAGGECTAGEDGPPGGGPKEAPC